MCSGRKIGETLQKYIFQIESVNFKGQFVWAALFFSSQFQGIIFNPVITQCFQFLFFFFLIKQSFSLFLVCTGRQNFLQFRAILVMLVDIRATSEASKQENLFRGQKDLYQFFLPWRDTAPRNEALHPIWGARSIKISDRDCS